MRSQITLTHARLYLSLSTPNQYVFRKRPNNWINDLATWLPSGNTCPPPKTRIVLVQRQKAKRTTTHPATREPRSLALALTLRPVRRQRFPIAHNRSFRIQPEMADPPVFRPLNKTWSNLATPKPMFGAIVQPVYVSRLPLSPREAKLVINCPGSLQS